MAAYQLCIAVPATRSGGQSVIHFDAQAFFNICWEGGSTLHFNNILICENTCLQEYCFQIHFTLVILIYIVDDFNAINQV